MTIDASDAFRVAVELDAMGVRAGARAYAVVQHYGALATSRIKARAGLPRAGPPGPRIITGDYNRSINMQMTSVLGNPTAEIGTNRPQGWRLETGFYGEDSLGRRYSQPPYLHFGPGLDDIAAPFEAAIAALADGGFDLGPVPVQPMPARGWDRSAAARKGWETRRREGR